MSSMPFDADVIQRAAAEWTTINPFLAKNDIGVESDTGRQKIGVGQRWADTSYQSLVASTSVARIVQITQAAYDALATKDSSTLYIITAS